MRIAIVSGNRRKIGGTEHNLDVLLPEFERRSHLVLFAYFNDEPAARQAVRTGPRAQLVHVSDASHETALKKLGAFRPDLINVHSDIPASFQEGLLGIAPCAFSVHNYYGTCISGLKTHQFPIIQPCERRFGPACLALYMPRRCGGLNPVTMIRRYNKEARQLAALRQYDAVITYSAHMESEYKRHDMDPSRLYRVPYEVTPKAAVPGLAMPPLEGPINLLFIGRMERLKGGQTLLASLPAVRSALNRPVTLNLAGDGPQRGVWEAHARRLMAGDSAIDVKFGGWQGANGLDALLRETHLLVIPSLWPEPFGKVGAEAGMYGVPVAAFSVGGISEWLTSGVNGFTAPGQRPTPAGLATAIIRCLESGDIYRSLCMGATREAARFNLSAHVDHLLKVFETILGTSQRRAASHACSGAL